MPVMGKDGYSSKGSTQLSAKVDEQLKEDFRAACDAAGETMTDMIEQKMKEVVEEHGTLPDSQLVTPDDDLLADAYERLRLASGPLDRIETDEAETEVAEATRVKKKHVREAVFRRLEERGYITPAWGTIIIHEHTEGDQDER
jgi:antitoxin component of RelBE/YafQ-DinJ toxin-antitoxin module